MAGIRARGRPAHLNLAYLHFRLESLGISCGVVVTFTLGVVIVILVIIIHLPQA